MPASPVTAAMRLVTLATKKSYLAGDDALSKVCGSLRGKDYLASISCDSDGQAAI